MAPKKLPFVLAFLAFFQAPELAAQVNTWNRQHNDQLIKRSADGNFFHFGRYFVNPSTPDTLKKVNSSGMSLWTKIFPSNIYITEVAAAPDSGCYATGTYVGTFSFGGYTLTGSATKQNLWLARLNKNGSFQWIVKASGGNGIYPSALAASAGKVVLAGKGSNGVNFLGSTLTGTVPFQFFVAALSTSGTLTAIKEAICTTTTTNKTYTSGTMANSCGIDGAGNIYVMTRSHGYSTLDTFKLGRWQSDNDYGLYTENILKFDASLNPLRRTQLEECYYYCSTFKKMLVRQNGEIFYIQSFYNGQSGSDVATAKICKMDQSGVISATYTFTNQRKSFVDDIEMDECENLYFVGLLQDHITTQTHCQTLLCGRLSPSLSQDWLYQHNDCQNTMSGWQVLYAGANSCLITGTYDDTLNLTTQMVRGNLAPLFIGHIQGSGGTPCAKITATEDRAFHQMNALSIVPNPAVGAVTVQADFEISRSHLFTLTGQLLLESPGQRLNVGQIAPGVYLLKVAGAEGQHCTGRLVVNH